jgi:formyl-CoA transferase
MALYHLRASGSAEGQMADIALFESAFRMLEPLVAEYSLTGKVKERGGHIGQGAAPSGTFKCKDGTWVVMVTSTQRTFVRLAEVMGRTDLLKDPRFDTNPHRSEHRYEIYEIVQEWFSRHTSDEVSKILDENGVPVCPIYSIADIFNDPQYRARGDLIEVDHPVLGTMTMTGIVPKLSATPGAVRFPGPCTIGEHNREILIGELGLGDADLQALQSEGVI